MGFVWFIQSQWPPPVVPSHLPMSSLHRPCHLERLLLSSHGNALQAPLPNHKVHQTSSTKLWTPGFQENVFMLGILSFKRSIFFSLNQRIQVSLIQNPCFNYVLTAVSLKQSIHIHPNPTIPHFPCSDHAKNPSTPSAAHWQNPSSAVPRALRPCCRWRWWRGAVEDLGSPTTARTRKHPKHLQVEPGETGRKNHGFILGPSHFCWGDPINWLPLWFMY